MSPAPLTLSVVVPSHDTRDLTLACLASLRRASPPGTQVVLVDDGGSDGTAEAVAAHDPDVLLAAWPEAVGFTRAANRGLALATGDVVLLLNSDTEVDGAGLAAVLHRFAAEPRLGIAGARLHYPDGSSQWSGGREPTLLWLFALASGAASLLGRSALYRRLRPASGTERKGPSEVGWVTGAAMAIRRSVWQSVGPFDEAFRFYGQDLDLCARVRQAGFRVELLPDFRVLHHHGATIRQEGEQTVRSGGGEQHLELLWTDLLRWARKSHGERWAQRGAGALRAGATLRLLGRASLRPFVSAECRSALREADAAVRRAAARVRAPTADE